MYPEKREGGTEEVFMETFGEGTKLAVVMELGKTMEGREDDALVED